MPLNFPQKHENIYQLDALCKYIQAKTQQLDTTICICRSSPTSLGRAKAIFIVPCFHSLIDSHLSKMGFPHPKQQDNGTLPMLPRFSFASSILQPFNQSRNLSANSGLFKPRSLIEFRHFQSFFLRSRITKPLPGASQ